jgi:hypothetical protein
MHRLFPFPPSYAINLLCSNRLLFIHSNPHISPSLSNPTMNLLCAPASRLWSCGSRHVIASTASRLTVAASVTADALATSIYLFVCGRARLAIIAIVRNDWEFSRFDSNYFSSFSCENLELLSRCSGDATGCYLHNLNAMRGVGQGFI